MNNAVRHISDLIVRASTPPPRSISVSPQPTLRRAATAQPEPTNEKQADAFVSVGQALTPGAMQRSASECTLVAPKPQHPLRTLIRPEAMIDAAQMQAMRARANVARDERFARDAAHQLDLIEALSPATIQDIDLKHDDRSRRPKDVGVNSTRLHRLAVLAAMAAQEGCRFTDELALRCLRMINDDLSSLMAGGRLVSGKDLDLLLRWTVKFFWDVTRTIHCSKEGNALVKEAFWSICLDEIRIRATVAENEGHPSDLACCLKFYDEIVKNRMSDQRSKEGHVRAG